MSIFLTFEAPRGSWDILFNPLEAIADFYFFGNIGLIKCQDMCISLDFLSALSNDSSDVRHALFSQGCCHLCCCQRQVPTSDNSFRSVLSWGYTLHLVEWKRFILRIFSDCLRLFNSISKFPFCVFFRFWRGRSRSHCDYLFC